MKQLLDGYSKEITRPLVSTVFPDGRLVETLYNPKEQKTLFCLGNQEGWQYVEKVTILNRHYVPYSSDNNLIRNGVILFPSTVAEYESEEALIQAIHTFLHRYVDIDPVFERLSVYYILFTWVYDRFNELPYIRVRGDYGTGKTRFLQAVGSLCYKPIFSSGASTNSPLFRILDTFRGTFIIDEADFRFSDEKADLVKILNNGTSRGFPILRSEISYTREINPRSYAVYGPKLVATRAPFEDPALESRFLTKEMGYEHLRADIPINLPLEFQEEALHLRNQLLFFRLQHYHKVQIKNHLVNAQMEPRLNQILVPLLSLIEEEQTCLELMRFAEQFQKDLVQDRGMEMEGQILEIIGDMMTAASSRLSIKEIAEWFIDRFGEEYERKITSKWIGYVIRKKLNIHTEKNHGMYIIAPSEKGKILRLLEKYDLHRERENRPEEKQIKEKGIDTEDGLGGL